MSGHGSDHFFIVENFVNERRRNMDNNYTVYMHVNKITQQKYIGITYQRPQVRWGKQGNGYKNQFFYCAIELYGWDNFEHIILHENLSQIDACLLERKYISEFDTYANGYNCSFGGESSINKKIICVNSNEIFDDLKEASKYFGIPETTLKANCNSNKISYRCDHSGRYYYFEYYDENEVYLLEKSILKKSKRPIICIETMELFCTPTEVEHVMGIFATNVTKVLNHKYSQTHGFHFMFYDEYIDKKYPIIKSKKRNKPLICLNDGKIFDSQLDACRYYNIFTSAIFRCCNDINTSVQIPCSKVPYCFAFLDDFVKDPYLYYNTIRNTNNLTKPVKCIETGMVFISISEASKFYSIIGSGIYRSCTKTNQFAHTLDGKKYKFVYILRNLKELLKEFNNINIDSLITDSINKIYNNYNYVKTLDDSTYTFIKKVS